MATDVVCLGHDTYSGLPVAVGAEARRSGLYVIGKTGTGKTTLLVNLIVQDIEQGRGVCFLDPHGDAVDEVIARIPEGRLDDVYLVDPEDTDYPFGLNLFSCRDSANAVLYSATASQVMHVFQKLWGPVGLNPSWGPQLEDLLYNSTLTLLERSEYALTELPLLLTNAAFRNELVRGVRSQEVRDFWEMEYHPLREQEQRDFRRSTLNKVRPFLARDLVRNIVGQSQTTVDFSQLIVQRKVLLVKLPRRLEDVTTLVGSMLIAQLLDAAFARGELSQAARSENIFCLYADEYQRFDTPDFAVLLAEARKYGIATTVAHQWRSQLHAQNRQATLNGANLVVFQVIGGDDADELSKQFGVTPQPGEPVLEQITEPAMDYWTEWVWDPPEAEQEFVQIEGELKQAEIELSVLSNALGYGQNRRELIRDADCASENPDMAPWGLWHLHEIFNPCFFDDRVRRYAFTTTFRNGEKFCREAEKRWNSTPLHPPMNAHSRARNVTTYRFPTEFPCYIEWQIENQEFPDPRRKPAEEALLAELRALLSPYRTRAEYLFDPRGSVPREQSLDQWGDEAGRYFWRIRRFPEMVEWVREKIRSSYERVEHLRMRHSVLKRCHKQVERSEYRGYETPIRDERVRDDWTEELVPRMRWKEGPPRLISDIQNEIASDLVALAPLTARCKIMGSVNGQDKVQEYRVAVNRSQAGVDSQELARRRSLIQERTRAQLCRPREQVESEITARQQPWRTLEPESAAPRRGGPVNQGARSGR